MPHLLPKALHSEAPWCPGRCSGRGAGRSEALGEALWGSGPRAEACLPETAGRGRALAEARLGAQALPKSARRLLACRRREGGRGRGVCGEATSAHSCAPGRGGAATSVLCFDSVEELGEASDGPTGVLIRSATSKIKQPTNGCVSNVISHRFIWEGAQRGTHLLKKP